MKWNDLNDESCPMARAMGVVGDRWTLLILRDAMSGIRRFDQFQENLGITRHVLAERLKKLEALGLMRREPYQDRPVRYDYRLTRAGKEFAPVMLAMTDWAARNLPHDDPAPFRFVARDTGTEIEPALTDRLTGQELTYRSVRMVPANKVR
ncbi:MAG: transcriptional regulator [Rhodobacteraceae bacterium]|nr:transcriptional regulator [Paracoccaceae bacterium]